MPIHWVLITKITYEFISCYDWKKNKCHFGTLGHDHIPLPSHEEQQQGGIDSVLKNCYDKAGRPLGVADSLVGPGSKAVH
jgi:hypothetical protein